MHSTPPDKQKSLFKAIFTLLILTAALPVTLLFLFQLFSVYRQFEIDSQELRAYYLENEKLKVKSQIDLLSEFIEQNIQKMEETLTQKVERQTSSAHTIATSIYTNNKHKLDDKTIQKMIIESLRHLRFNRNRGYFFITGLDGTEILYPIDPEVEGKNLLEIGNPLEKSVTYEMIEIVKLWNESFYQYIWARPDNPNYEFHKISYIKLFEPYNWIIGTGDYLEDVERAAQKGILQELEHFTIKNKNHVFIGEWDEQKQVITPLTTRGKSRWNQLNSNSQSLAESLIKAAKGDGGFIESEFPNLKDQGSSPQTSYVTGIKKWRWYIGANIFTDKVDKVIEQNRQKIIQQTRNQLILAFVLLAILFTCIFVFARLLANRILDKFDEYIVFFNNAANKSVYLDESTIVFPETLRLIQSVNKMIDIRRQSEKALLESEEKFRGLTENVQDVTIVLDPQGLITYVNPAIQRYTSSTAAHLGRAFRDYLHPEDRHYFEMMLGKALTHSYETLYLNEVRFIIPPDIEVTMDLSATYMPDTACVNGIVLHSRDVTQRRLAEADRDEIKARLDSFYKAAFEGIAITHGGVLIDFNDQLVQTLGYKREELIKKAYLDLVHEEDKPLVFSMAEKKVDSPYRFRAIHKNGSIRFLETRSRSINYHGKPARVSAIRDITENKKLEEEKALQQQQLMQADKMISLGILTAGVAHEINNPNQFISSHLEPLLMSFNDAKPILDRYMEEHGDFRMGGVNYSSMRERIPRYFNNIAQGSNRIKSIVSELKQFSKEDNIGQIEPLHINSVVQSALTLMKNLIKKTTDHFTLDLAKEIPPFQGHYQRLEQVMINLIQNACQALSEPPKTIEITTGFDAKKEQIFIKISDNGNGITPENLKRITDPFFTTKSDSGGIGLGLSISSNIIHEHKGQLLFSSEPGKGTIVTAILPTKRKMETTV